MIYIATNDFYSSVHDLFLDILGEESDLMPQTGEIPEDIKMLVFTGGQDINPALYGQKNTYSHFWGQRDAVEIDMLDLVVPMDIPIFGICRGHQLISAYFGGQLIQDLSVVGQRHEGTHEMVTDGETFHVNSMHHQGVSIPAENQEVIGWYKNVSELTIGRSYPYVTTQFHPEFGASFEVMQLIKNLLKQVL